MKQYILLTLCLGIADIAMAQKTTPGIFYWPNPDAENANSMVIPKEYAYNNKPLLTFTDRQNPSHIMVYDENIEQIKEFDIDNNKEFNYTLTYQKETRDVTNVTEVNLQKNDLKKSFKEWLEREQMYDSSIPSALNITKKENGDSIISIDYSKLQHQYNTNEQMYFGYSYFGLNYPKLYWIASKGNLLECMTSYSVTYSDWKPTEKEERSFSQRLPHICLYNLNLDNGGGTNCTNGTYLEISQTLFNQDEDYEYIIPKLALVASTSGENNNDELNPSTGEEIQVTRSTIISDKSEVATVGFQVVSSNGNIVKDIVFDNNCSFRYSSWYRFALITIGGNRYITINTTGGTAFYKIDNQISNIQKVKVAKGSMFVQPCIIDKNTTINISLGDNNDNGSEIIIVSMSGNKVNSATIPSGQKQTQLYANMPTGIYCISRLQNGKINETKKIIVK